MPTNRQRITTALCSVNCASKALPSRPTICGSRLSCCNIRLCCAPATPILTSFLSSRACKVAFWNVSLSFSHPTPLPPRFLKISRINNLPTTTSEIPRKIFITKILQVKILKAWDLRADFDRERPYRYCCVYCRCRDNDGMNAGLCARSDVTRGLWVSLRFLLRRKNWGVSRSFPDCPPELGPVRCSG